MDLIRLDWASTLHRLGQDPSRVESLTRGFRTFGCLFFHRLQRIFRIFVRRLSTC